MHALSEAEVLSDGQHLLAVEDITLARPMCAHSHGFAQVSLVRGGRADQHTEEGVNHLDTNTIVVLSPGSWHSYDPAPTIDLTNLYLSRDLLAAARIPHLPIDLPPSLREALDPTQAHGTVAPTPSPHNNAPPSRQSCARSATGRRAASSPSSPTSTGCWTQSPPSPAVSTPSPHSTLVPGLHRYGDHVTHAIALLHDRLEARWTLAALAGEVQLSSSQLVRTFRVDTGMPPMAYLQRIRAERMAYLLRTTDLSVAAIGRAVGWDDPSHASRRFTAHWRTSPASYRAQLG